MNIAYSELFTESASRHWNRASSQYRARPIGAEVSYRLVTARRIQIDESHGSPVFGKEEPIEIHPHVLRPITLEGKATQPVARFEVKADPALRKGGPTSPDWLIVTEHPYSNSWFTRAKFKAGSHRSSEERHTVRAADLAAALAELESRPHDPWETGKKLVAAVAPPVPVFDEDFRSQRSASWVFGVCSDPEAITESLARSAEAKVLLDLAERRALRVGPNKILIHRRVAHDANAVLFLAIGQALAGPLAADERLFEPVLQLVKQIYVDHLYNRTRRANREDGHHDDYSE